MQHLESSALRRELREYFRLAWPIVVAQLSFVSMGTVDTILAGRLGAPQLAAVAVGANVFFLMFVRSEEHTSELQSLMRSSYAVFCLNTKQQHTLGIPSHCRQYTTT